MRNFDRRYRLIAGANGGAGFSIGDVDDISGRCLRCSFNAERGDSESNNTASVTVYNLSPQSMAFLEQDNCALELQAGYNGDMCTIISGTVSHFEQAREGSDMATTISIVDGLVGTRDSSVSVGYSGAVNGRKILQDAANKMGFPILFSPSCRFQSFKNFSFVGTAFNLFHKVCGATQNNFSIQNGIIHVCSPNEPITMAVYVLSADTGLIGYPEKLYDSASSSNADNGNKTSRKTQIGWKVTFLMNGHIQVNDYVQLSSKTASGLYRVAKIDTYGDTEGTSETSWCCVAELQGVK